MNPAGIYISIPFCRQKCTYCNFASDVHPSSLLPRYLHCLATEITSRPRFWKKAGIPPCDLPVDSIYLGGGTPGLLDSGQLADLLGAVRTAFPMENEAEITLEASPENVTPARADNWAAVGINRTSLGVQSMVRAELRAVGRLHDAHTVAQAFSKLRAAGIQNISADLIAGLPYQTAESWEASLQALLELGPAHLSIYMLEVDADSRLGSEVLGNGSRYHAGAVPSEEQVADFYCGAMEILRAAGYDHYEISNFARPAKASRHNEKYWTHAPYFGFGTDAHSFDGERRWANTESLGAYLEMIEKGAPPIMEVKTLCSREKLEERLFLGLRRREGVSLSRLNAEFASSASVPAGSLGRQDRGVTERYAGPIREFCEAGWLEAEGDRLRLTDRGLLFSNEVFAGFLEGN
jgi:oxygen-independent coproporphyrinogen-3 oxidase